MSNSIIDMFLSNVTSQASAKNVATKESMDWQNIFDKSLFDVFKKISTNDRNNYQTPSGHENINQTEEQEISVKNKIIQAKGKHEETLSEISRSIIEQQFTNDNLAENIFRENSGFQQVTYMNFTQLNKYMNTYLEIENVNSSAKQKYLAEVKQDIFARIHFASSSEGVKIYARSRKLDDEYMLEKINHIITQFRFSKIAIHEIRLNGKII